MLNPPPAPADKYRRLESLRAAQALAPRVAQAFFKWTEYINSMFDVGRSMFDVH